jgi:AcrR family transcriptional regulator
VTDAGGRRPLSREAIVAEAREMIRSDGLDQLSLRRLGRRLGVSATALYAHIETKQDLLRAVAAGEFDRLVASYGGVGSSDPLERIRFHSRTYVAYARAEPELFSVLFLFPPAQTSGQLPDDLVLPAATAAFTWALDAVHEAIAGGQLATDDPLLLALTLWSGAHGVATVLQLGFGLPRGLEDQLVDEITDRILAGYRPVSASPTRASVNTVK